MRYYSLNFYSVSAEEESQIWIEDAEAESGEKAEHLLARNNPQLILNEEEFRRLFEKMAYLLKTQEKWIPGSLKKLYSYACADFRIEKLNEEVTYLHIRVPLSQKTAREDFEKCTSG